MITADVGAQFVNGPIETEGDADVHRCAVCGRVFDTREELEHHVAAIGLVD